MKRVAWLGALLAMFGILGMLQPSAAAQEVGAEAVPGEFIVKFAAGSTEAQQVQALRARGGEVAERIPELGVAVARFDVPKGVDEARTAALIQALESDVVIEYAEPNYVVRLIQEPVSPAPSATGEVEAQQAGTRRWLPFVQGPPILLPDDPQTGQQWAWSTIGAYRGWGLGTGSAQVLIAIIDSGVQPDHPDLASKLVAGYDFVDNDAIMQDGDGHGTHVAGTAAGITNNAVGVAGTCPSCAILPVRVLGDDGSGFTSDVIAGIRYAADRGAKVINLSLGDGPPSKAMDDAVNYAWSKGVLLACAAGNGGTSSTLRAYPGASPNCMAVANTNRTDGLGRLSNYGSWVDIAAPGTEIYSTYKGSTYAFLSGTSMASPHVAGAAGLLAAKGLNNVQIRARLEATADKIPGTGVYWTSGRLNILSAMR